MTVPFGAAHLPPERVTHDDGNYGSTIGAAPFVQEALRWLPVESSGEEAFPKELENDDLDLRSGQPETRKLARVLLVDDNRDMREYVERLSTGGMTWFQQAMETRPLLRFAFGPLILSSPTS